MVETIAARAGFKALLLGAVVGFAAFAAPALADDGGDVLPPIEPVLALTAQATAVYNTGTQAGLTLPPPPLPFLVLVSDTTVRQGTLVYLPIYVADDSGPGPFPGFPANINNQKADQEYMANLIYDAYGVTDFLVQVDGKTTVLNDDFTVGVKTPPLLDGTPPGRDYIVAATFLTPLNRGTHTVSIGGVIDDEPVVFVSYSVTVK